MKTGLTIITWMVVTIMTQAQAYEVVSPLRARGYTVLPTPQRVDLAPGDVKIDNSWKLVLQDVNKDDIAVTTLLQGMQEKTGIDLPLATPLEKVIRLAVKAGAVDMHLGDSRDKQIYLLRFSDSTIEITGNSPQGLFYGVQTFLQLLKRNSDVGCWQVPAGTIRDWPSFELRICHWDTKHHQDRIETLKRYLDWYAKFKINAVCFELEDKFAYPSHPVIGQPGAFTPEQLQDLVNYGLARYIQIIPNIQAPAHMGYVLKHDEFKHLRSDGSSYMAKFSDPGTYDLIFDMYKDVINATKGVDYLHVSTDEVYYAGIDEQDQKVRPYTPENRSLWDVEFITKARDFAAKHGRRVCAWLEMPILPQHINKIPADVIDGVVGSEDYVAIERHRDMRTLAYVPTQGAEWLFPSYFDWKDEKGEIQSGRLRDLYDTPLTGRATRVNPIGTFVAAWDDSGLHNETFWLGWVTGSAYGWHPGGASLPETTAEFFELYYGPGCEGLIDVYRDLQAGAQFYQSSWDLVPSKERGPAYGNSRGKQEINRRDEVLRLPELPSLPDLKMNSESAVWKTTYAQRVEQAKVEASRNERVRYTLQAYLPKVRHNRYNLEVLLALAELQRHHIEVILTMAQVEQDILKASQVAAEDKIQAAGLLIKAHNAVDRVVRDYSNTLGKLMTVWQTSMFPKNRSVNGKDYLYVMDDVKDHFADRRRDIDYMVAPEQRMGLSEFRTNLSCLIREYTRLQKIDAKALPDKILED